MSVGGVGGGSQIAQLMQILQQGMNEQVDLSKKMISIGVENTIIGDKMQIAQGIIDAYA